MEFKEIQDLLRLVNRTNLTEVEIEKENFKIKIRRKSPESNVIYATQQAPAALPVQAANPLVTAPAAEKEEKKKKSKPTLEVKEEDVSEANLYTFKSPMIGTFYRASSPQDPAFVSAGDTVQKGQVLCIIEAMKLFNEIESEIEGKVIKILVENQQPVEYDQPLFLIEPSS